MSYPMLFTILMAFISHTLYGQGKDELILEKRFGGYRIYQQDQMLNVVTLLIMLSNNTDSRKLAKKARAAHSFGAAFLGTGVYILLRQSIRLLLGKTILIIGTPIALACIGVSIWLIDTYNHFLKNAVHVYNLSLKHSTTP